MPTISQSNMPDLENEHLFKTLQQTLTAVVTVYDAIWQEVRNLGQLGIDAFIKLLDDLAAFVSAKQETHEGDKKYLSTELNTLLDRFKAISASMLQFNQSTKEANDAESIAGVVVLLRNHLTVLATTVEMPTPVIYEAIIMIDNIDLQSGFNDDNNKKVQEVLDSLGRYLSASLLDLPRYINGILNRFEKLGYDIGSALPKGFAAMLAEQFETDPEAAQRSMAGLISNTILGKK